PQSALACDVCPAGGVQFTRRMDLSRRRFRTGLYAHVGGTQLARSASQSNRANRAHLFGGPTRFPALPPRREESSAFRSVRLDQRKPATPGRRRLLEAV